MGPKSGLSQTSPIPRSPDGDKNIQYMYSSLSLNVDTLREKFMPRKLTELREGSPKNGNFSRLLPLREGEGEEVGLGKHSKDFSIFAV